MSEKKSFVEKLMPAVGKMQENIYVSAITAGMMNAMPVLMASAIFQLFYSFPSRPGRTFCRVSACMVC